MKSTSFYKKYFTGASSCLSKHGRQRERRYYMKKVIKWFSVFAVIGTAIGLVVAYFCKNNSDSPEENASDHTEEEDFDLDADLKPASEREYVSLNKDPEGAKDQDVTEEKTSEKPKED